ncbi:MAG TPA: hypothetical protein VM327_02720 [Candidatus Thermoplasmatota archaeon]|nr:hypothetical protein [Candidatus Thermoplasmatota archaeon]
MMSASRPAAERRRFDMDGSGLLGLLAAVAILGVVGVVGVGVYLYTTDYAMRADVQDKQCGLGAGNVVSVHTRVLGIDHDVVGVPQHECTIIRVGDEVEYHLRTKHTTIYRDGSCFYDSQSGPACGRGPLALV